ncbi:DUF724 domain-containing protein 7 isoform X2 [Daucus carota subsp. sativus]|uniref:DUF724 domain-containing protein 7 isoform X2 n=1 Tax=Daucus carota subsp. sativus TaxID=79200 RepID=UPI0030832DB5
MLNCFVKTHDIVVDMNAGFMDTRRSSQKFKDKVMASNTKFSVHGTEMAGIINLPNTHQMEEPTEDTLNGFINPSGSNSSNTGRDVVMALPCNQSFLSRGKKASDRQVEGTKRNSKGKRKEICAIVPVRQESVPFEKNELLWKEAEALEAFTLTPHKPHFRPLESCREVEREGKAVGLMVIYDNITKKTLNLRCETAREDIEDYLSHLKELEPYGFDVSKQRNALNRFLFLKEQLEDIDNLSKENKRQITEFDRELCILKEKRIQMQDEIQKLMEEARLADLGVKKSEHDIASDQLAIRNHNEELTRIRMELRELLASPLF